MANWRKWIRVGLLSTILIALAAFVVSSGDVERDLAARIGERLTAEGQNWAGVAVTGRDATIAGTAPSPESVASALAAAADVAGVRAVVDRTALLPSASPYLWSARRVGRVVTLAGDVPSEAMRNSVLAGARRALPEAEIHDEMKLARGAPAAFNTATAFALTRLAGLSEGTVTLTDATLAFTGIAATPKAFADARQAIRGEVPSAFALGPVDILPARAEPFVWSAAYDGKQLVLSGYVPNDVVSEALQATAKATLSRVPVVDSTIVASGEPEGFAEAASFAITALDRLSQGGVTLDGLNLDISGTARTVDDYEALLAGLANDLPSGMKVVSDAIRPASVSPYEWEGEKNGSDVILTGYVPSPEARAEVERIAKAGFAGLKVSNRVRIAAGEPKMDWLGAIKFSLAALAKLGTGTVSLGDKTFAIQGEAASPDAFAELLGVNSHTLPASLDMAGWDVVPPKVSPYRFVAERGARQVILTGYAPSEKDKGAILDLVRAKFGTDEVVDRLAFASGAPAGFTTAIEDGLHAITRLAGGRIEMVDANLKIDGDAYNPAAAEQIAGALEEGKPESFTVAANIGVRQTGQPATIAHCRDLLVAELQRGRVEFQGAKAQIADDSYGLLDRVAATLVRCPEARVEIGAHTDAEGSAARNRDLTQTRAEAIVDYLVDAGVMREQLTPVGYGETRPVADNNTPAGRSQNRRIEFTMAMPDQAPAAPAGGG